MNSNLQFAVAVAVFAITYYVVTLCQPDRRLCNKFESLWEAPSGSLLELSTETKKISDACTDKDLKFVTDFFSTVALMYSDGGFQDLSEVKKADKADILTTSFLNGLVNPIGGLKSAARSVWILWNQSDCEKSLARLKDRYSGPNMTAIIWGLIGMTAQ